MAESIQTYTKVSVNELQVSPIFTELMKTATDKDSMYIKAKESLLDYLNDSNMNDQEKAAMLSDLISKLTVEMTDTSLKSAIQIATENRDAAYKLSKLNEDILMSQEARDKIATDILYVEAQIAKMDADKVSSVVRNWKDQAEMYWKTGVDTTGLDVDVHTTLPVSTNLPAITTGSGYYEVEFGKTKQYELLSSSVRNYGVLGYSYDAEGNLANARELQGDVPGTTTAASWNGLVKQQHAVAVRQELGFDNNMRQHAANSSASMIGLMLSSDTFQESDDYVPYLQLWTKAMGELLECPGYSCPDPNAVE